MNAAKADYVNTANVFTANNPPFFISFPPNPALTARKESVQSFTATTEKLKKNKLTTSF